MGNTAGPIGSLRSSSDASIMASQPFLLKWLEASLRVRKKGNCSLHLPTDFTTWQCLSASQMEDREPATGVDKTVRNRVNGRQMLRKIEKASIGRTDGKVWHRRKNLILSWGVGSYVYICYQAGEASASHLTSVDLNLPSKITESN